MVVVAGRKPHVLNMLGVSTGTLPVSVCLLPVPVSTLSYTPFHRSPTINSQRFALFDSTFSVRFKLISHSLSAPFPLPLRSAEDVPTCLVCVCRRLPPSRSVAVCREAGGHPWFVGPFRELPSSCTDLVAIALGAGGEEERWPRGWGGDGAAARCGS